MSKNLLLSIVIGLGALIGILLVFGIVIGVGWPWWVGIFLIIGLIGVGLVGIIIKKVLLKKKEQEFVSQIIEQDNAYIQSLKADEKKHVSELQEKWKEAVDALKSSHLKKQGNPLYVLPWYMVLGESGSGKTTSINSAKLSSPFAEVNHIPGFSGTKNCDWWFFEQAILLDTAGRYAIPVDEGRDKDEWQKFVSLLAKYRKKEPLNGLVVTVAADKILQSRPEVLEDDGKNIRRRIDELMRALGSKFPVYVLVTKCDLVQGMTQFCRELTEAGQQQAMGMINHAGGNDPENFVRNAMHTISERLRNIRLLQLHKTDPRHLEPSLLLFPEEFSKLEEGLVPFMKAAFQENPYQESPLLRGVYFSSGRQEGSPYSHFLKNLGLIEERDVLPGTSKGLFLHDFFDKILPRERHLFAPTRQALEWGRLTRNLGLLSWLAIGVAVCGLLSFSFVKNLSIIRSVPKEAPVLKGQLAADVSMLESYRKGIIKVEEGNRHWWIPRFGLTHSRDIEVKLKENYCSLVDKGIITSMDRKIGEDTATFSASTPDSAYARSVMHIVRRINLLDARIKGGGLDDLRAKPQPTYLPFITSNGNGRAPEMAKNLADLYLYRLVWSQGRDGLGKEQQDLKKLLTGTLDRKRADFRWVAVYVSENEQLPGATLKEFWGGSNELADQPSVPGAFTIQGKKYVDAVFDEICAALGDAQSVNAQKPVFQDWYRGSYLAQWEAFARSFPRGQERLLGKEEWAQAAARMGGSQGPYFAFLKRMKAELSPYEPDRNAPAWLTVVSEFNDVASQAATVGAVGAAGGGSLLTKVAETGTRLKEKIARTGAQNTDTANAASARMAEVRAFAAYSALLTEISSSLKASRTGIFQIASTAFNEGTQAASPFFKARNALNEMKASSRVPQGEALWQLVQGPFDFLWAYTCREAACQLQDLWVKDVLVQVQGVMDPMQAAQILAGPQGVGTRFMQGPAAPFLNRDLRGYTPKEVLGRKIPMEGSFLSFSARSQRPMQPNYTVTITGLPTDSNPDASVKPHGTRLELGCANGMITLENLNYPVRKVFNYNPQNCGTAVFTIEVGNITLTRQYEGNLGFSKFLSEFPGGQHTFTPNDFPDKSASLRRLGIRYIKVRYRFEGNAREAAGLFSQGAGTAPERITECWGR